MAYDHTNYGHLALLAGAVRDLHNRPLAEFNGFLAADGLMRTHRILEWTVRFTAWRSEWSLERTWTFVFRDRPTVNADARASFIDHLLKGKDKTDPKSAGGFNALELARIEAKLRDMRVYLPEPGGAA